MVAEKLTAKKIKELKKLKTKKVKADNVVLKDK